jgi:hypothetical protein
MIRLACLLVGADYEIGSLPPEEYLQWHEWAGVQYKAGLRQAQCGRCGKWKFPQELSDIVDICHAYTTRRGGQKVTLKSPTCLVCAKPE